MHAGLHKNAHPGLKTPPIWVIQVVEGVLDNFTPVYIFSFSFSNIKVVVV
jgi:hypothetical protein